MNINEAAKNLCITRHAVWMAVKNNRLNSAKIDGQWSFTQQDLEDYKNIKYKRDLSYKKDDEYTVGEAAKYLNCSKIHVYYACSSFKLPIVKDYPILIKLKDLDEYKKVMKTYKQTRRLNVNLNKSCNVA